MRPSGAPPWSSLQWDFFGRSKPASSSCKTSTKPKKAGGFRVATNYFTEFVHPLLTDEGGSRALIGCVRTAFWAVLHRFSRNPDTALDMSRFLGPALAIGA